MIGARGGTGAAPDLIEPVIGFREWRLDARGLVAPFTGLLWDGGVERAECLPRPPRRLLGVRRRRHPPHPEPAPGPDCDCGIYAYFEPWERWEPWHVPRLVSGAVVLWGRIEVHSIGMRAEYARPVALAYPPIPGHQRAVIEAARRVDLEAVPLADVRAAALRHGRPMPDSLVPAA